MFDALAVPRAVSSRMPRRIERIGVAQPSDYHVDLNVGQITRSSLVRFSGVRRLRRRENQKNICPNPDGFGETPHAFSFGRDNYPLMKPLRC